MYSTSCEYTSALPIVSYIYMLSFADKDTEIRNNVWGTKRTEKTREGKSQKSPHT